jgi:hypothetical protein
MFVQNLEDESLAERFAFINFPLANLFSIGGLPVEPFRTDRP